MGLFKKIFGSKETELVSLETVSNIESNIGIGTDQAYIKLQNLYGECINDNYDFASLQETAYVLKERISKCDSFLGTAAKLNNVEMNSRMKKEVIKSKTNELPRYYYHRGFDSKFHFWDSKDEKMLKDQLWEKLLDRVTRSRNNHIKVNKTVLRWLSAHPAEVVIGEESIKRQMLIEMPEIKYASVTKKYNKDKQISFVVLDTETTGLKASSGRIIQLSAVKYVDWEPVEYWDTYLNPKKPIPADATAVNGITDDMVADMPTIKQVAQSFIDFVGKADVVGYNLPFDLKFLYAEGIDLTETKRKYYDVLALARKIYKDYLDHFTLSDVASYNKIVFPAHNSLCDCFATGDVFECIVDEIIGD